MIKISFIRNFNGSNIFVQIYVDDIIFGYTDEKLCSKFAKLMQSKYEMSMMGELTYFLGFQVKQVKDGILCEYGRCTSRVPWLNEVSKSVQPVLYNGCYSYLVL